MTARLNQIVQENGAESKPEPEIMRLGLRLPPPLYDAAYFAAVRQRTTVSSIIGALIEKHLVADIAPPRKRRAA